MAKVISILNPKGGVGKSTLTINLARALQLEGLNILVVDIDAQGTSRTWRQASDNDNYFSVVGAHNPNSLEKDINSISESFDHILIDGLAKTHETLVSMIKVSDTVLIPITPSSADLWGVSDLVDMVKASQEGSGRPRTAFLISRQIVGTRLAQELRDALKQFGLPIFKARISQRIAFAESLSMGSTVLDQSPNSPASQEIRDIAKELLRGYV